MGKSSRKMLRKQIIPARKEWEKDRRKAGRSADFMVADPFEIAQTGEGQVFEKFRFKVFHDPNKPPYFTPTLYYIEPGMIVHYGHEFNPLVIVVRLEDDAVVYSPRMMPLEAHTPENQEWLLRHPGWAVPGCDLDWDKALTEITIDSGV